MRTPVGVALAAAALTLASAAAAKGPLEAGSVEICGPESCAAIEDEALLGWLGELRAGGQTPGTPPPVGPFYELRGEVLAWVLPDAAAVRSNMGGSSWYPLAPGLAEALRRAAAGVDPFPAPRITNVYLDEREAVEATPYAALLGPGTVADSPTPGARWVTIGIVSESASPWTGSSAYAVLWYVPGERTVWNDGRWVRVQPALAERVETDLGLLRAADPAPASQIERDAGAGRAGSSTPVGAVSASSFPWAAVAGAVAGGLLLVAGLARLPRAGRRPVGSDANGVRR